MTYIYDSQLRVMKLNAQNLIPVIAIIPAIAIIQFKIHSKLYNTE